ncbi:GH25 family lysozyme [Dactylosporangium sp. McL0621]|uniref:GH25 family lysozyme n=1 Tax=Dactylosporangium sp. McL0621 TaxID=3415678 RepID=UPI003CEA2395
MPLAASLAIATLSATPASAVELLMGAPANAAPPGGDDTGWAGRGTAGHVAPAPRGLAVVAPPRAINGRDVSSHDHNGGRTVDWPAWRAAGEEFGFVKATEGTTYTNPYFSGDYRAAKSAGMYVGAYHFARPDLGDPVGQANHFADQMQWTRDGRTLPPFLDAEWPYDKGIPDCYGLSQAAMRSWISSFLSQVESRIGTTPMIYTNVNWWNPCTGNSGAFARYPLDISSCLSAPPSAPGWGGNWTFWQYDIPDCRRGATQDFDVFNGTLADLAALAGGGVTPTPGSPAGASVVHDGYTSEFTVNAADGHLQETYLARLGGAWGTQDLSASAGTPAVAGQPVAVVHDGYTSVYTVDAGNGHVQETYLARLGGAWVTQDLGAVAAAQTPAVVVHDGYTSVFTVTPGGQLQETYLPGLGAAWTTQPLPAAGSAPGLSAVVHDGYTSVFSVSTGGQLRETFLARMGGSWVSGDLGAAAAAQTPAVAVHDGYTSVYTVTSAGQLQETFLPRLGAAWTTQPLPATGVTPALSAVVHDGYTSVFSVTSGGHLSETFLARLGGAWISQDLTTGAGTPNAVGRPSAVVHDGYVSVFTVGATSGHVSETYLPRIGAAWASHDLTSTAGTPAARP